MVRNIVSVVFLVSLLIKCFSSDSDEYYCPREEVLLGKQCYKNMKSAVMNKNDAEKHCQSLNKELPDSTLEQNKLSGWLKDTVAARGDVKDKYCVYAYTNPLGLASPDNPLFNIALCSAKLHVLCSKKLPNGNACESGWVEAIRNTYKFCVRPSEKTSAAADTFAKDICPEDSTIFPFNYRDNAVELSYGNVVDTDPNLMQPFWTPFYVTEDKTIEWFTKEEATHFKTCLYKTGTLHVMMVSCDTIKQFHCQSPAKEIPHDDTIDPDPYHPDNDYSCDTIGDTLCENKCYKHWTSYKTQFEAEKNCTSSGYTLTTQSVPCLGYITGWVHGSFEDGSLSTNSTLHLNVDYCVYVHEGETKLADCRRRAKALHTVQLKKGGSDSCPDSFHQCEDKSLCVGSSGDKMTWSNAVNTVPRDRRRLLQTGSVLKDCSTTIKDKLKEPHWVGAALSEGGVIEYNNGEEITVKSEKQCLKIIGGKLVAADCNTMMYFTCEKLAKETASSSAIVIALVVGPLLIIGVVLLLIYRKKGKEMCMSRSTVKEVDLTNNGLTLTNPLSEVTGDRYDVENKAETSDKKNTADQDNLYSEVEI